MARCATIRNGQEETPLTADPDSTRSKHRNLRVLAGQHGLNMAAWTMANPSVVLVYLAVSQDVPVFIAGMLVTVRNSANLLSALFGADRVASRSSQKADIAKTNLFIAACFLFAILTFLIGSVTVIAAALILIVACIGVAEQYQIMLKSDFVGDMLESEDRTRMTYVSLALGGAMAIGMTSLVHIGMDRYPRLTAHSTIIGIAVVFFCLSALTILLVREIIQTGSKAEREAHAARATGSISESLTKFRDNTLRMMAMPWFRQFMAVRFTLMTIRLSVPFFAILAALTHSDTHRGLTAMVISTAVGFVVSGPLWAAASKISNRFVMLMGGLLAASCGLLLVVHHVFQIFNTVHVHAVTLFLVTVAAEGVTNARSLYYLDIAPKVYRVRGLAVSKTLIRATGIVVTTIMAAAAHMHHVVWAIALLAGLNLIAGGAAFVLAGRGSMPMSVGRVS